MLQEKTFESDIEIKLLNAKIFSVSSLKSLTYTELKKSYFLQNKVIGEKVYCKRSGLLRFSVKLKSMFY